jgi:hypothetical protein
MRHGNVNCCTQQWIATVTHALCWNAGAPACPRGPKQDAAAFIALLKTAATAAVPASTSTHSPVSAKRGKEQATVDTSSTNRVGSLLLLKHAVDLLKHDLACRILVLRGAPVARLTPTCATRFELCVIASVSPTVC